MLEELRASGGMTNGLSDDFNKWPVARSFAQLARELEAAKEKVAEKEEEVGELKSERSNTRVRPPLDYCLWITDCRLLICGLKILVMAFGLLIVIFRLLICGL